MTSNKIHNPWPHTQFVKSVVDPRFLPPSTLPEIAFAGRSNVGKSSVINAAVGRVIARRSKTPGRTQALNFFVMPHLAYLVDLPGYGYAKVPEAARAHWQHLLETYLTEREALRGIVLVVDSRHPPQPLDLHMLQWTADYSWPIHIVLNKSDALSRQQSLRALQHWQSVIPSHNNKTLSFQLCSTLKKTGIDILKTTLESWM